MLMYDHRNLRIYAVFLLLQIILSSLALEYSNIAFIIITQSHPYHKSLANRLKKQIISQAAAEEKSPPNVWITQSHGSWLYVPLFPMIVKKNRANIKWVLFSDEFISIKLPNVLQELSKYNHKEKKWIGFKIFDDEPTIIHHFFPDVDKFPFPNGASGFAMSMTLIKTLNDRIQNNNTLFQSDFSIDAVYELANFVRDNGNGVEITNSNNFCVVASTERCATYPRSHEACMEPIPVKEIFFAVKTYHAYHSTRVDTVKNTWGFFTKNIGYFSDVFDSSIPTIDLKIENTDKGHCGKTIAILKYVSKKFVNNSIIKYVVIADDDTVLSVHRLAEILSCYGDKNLALGERYGFNMLGGNGYEYLSGGAGIVLSLDVAEKLSKCECPSNNSPDDMWLGVCLAKLKIPSTHSPLFHQARPNDYPVEYLTPNKQVSFHKFWEPNRRDIYSHYFLYYDIEASRKLERIRHDEF